eukprot:TRINITY_DN8265_c0_g1_i2.p1 TRINITY_DN8265_c0_g1~~TRINITY_DN8265_c0_g1_i2.p1  ORF type:complete len:231 (+),score=46.72 TRINITY_DN8265_c0_g1_i2:239-931(+)
MDSDWRSSNTAAILQFFQLPTIPLAIFYLFMVFAALKLRLPREELSLKHVTAMFSLFLSLINIPLVVIFVRVLLHEGTMFPDHPDGWVNPEMVRGCYWLFVSKVIELGDTVLMVLRKRHRQISFLHVFHHVTVLLLADFANHLSLGPLMAVSIATNSCVHVVMYFYYFLTAMGWPVPWKQAVTVMQMVQFVGLTLHGAFAYAVYTKTCVFLPSVHSCDVGDVQHVLLQVI